MPINSVSPLSNPAQAQGLSVNPSFANDFQNITPELLLLLQQLLAASGGDAGAMSPNCFNHGGGFGSNSGGGGGSSSFTGGDNARSLGEFLGGGNGNSSGGSWVSGGDGYVPGGLESMTRGGAVGNSAQGERAVSWAETQLGVSESNNPGAVRGYSRGNWQAWCADFVSTALQRSGGSRMGHQSSVQGILDWGRRNDRFTSAAAARANPGSLQIGDVATWKSNGRSHVGLVTGVDARTGNFTTIEGNTSDRVARRTHSFSSRGLTGFVRATDSRSSTRTASAASGSRSGSSSSRSGSSSSSRSSGSSSSGSRSSSSGSSSSSSRS